MPLTQQQPRNGKRGTPELPAVDFALRARDVRRKRPPALSLPPARLETLRRAARVCRAAGARLRRASSWRSSRRCAQGGRSCWRLARCRGTSARPRRSSTSPSSSRSCSSRAPASTPAWRAARAGEDRLLAVPGHARSRCSSRSPTATRSRRYYIFYGSLFFAVAYVSLLRPGYDRVTGRVLLRMAGYQRRAVLVGTGQHIEAVGHALRDAGASDVQRRRLHLADAASRQRAASRSAGWRTSTRSSGATASTR